MHYRHPEHYEVGREKIREHAVAVKNDDAYHHDEKVAGALGGTGETFDWSLVKALARAAEIVAALDREALSRGRRITRPMAAALVAKDEEEQDPEAEGVITAQS